MSLNKDQNLNERFALFTWSSLELSFCLKQFSSSGIEIFICNDCFYTSCMKKNVDCINSLTISFGFIHCSSGGLHQFTDLAEGEQGAINYQVNRFHADSRQ